MPATYTDRLQGLTTSVAVKAPCRVATIGAIWLSGIQTIDGISLSAGDRVLVRDQSDAAENGIWVAGSGNWDRALDFDGTRDAVGGTIVPVNEGVLYAGSTWRVDGDGPVTPGISNITFRLDIFASDLTSPTGSGLIGFVQAGMGMTTRTVQDRLREFASLKDFGAIGDDVADDSAAFKKALESGLPTFVPNGTYRVKNRTTATLTAHSEMIFAPGASIVLDAAIGAQAFTVDGVGVWSLKISGGQFDASAVPNPGTGGDVGSIWDLNNLAWGEIEKGDYIAGADYLALKGDTAIDAVNCGALRIVGNRFVGWADNAIYLTGANSTGPSDDGGPTTISGNYFLKNSCGISVKRRNKNVIIIGNQFEQNYVDWGCYEVGAGEIQPGDRLVVTGNLSVGANKAFAEVRGYGEFVCTGNTIRDWGYTLAGVVNTNPCAIILLGCRNTSIGQNIAEMRDKVNTPQHVFVLVQNVTIDVVVYTATNNNVSNNQIVNVRYCIFEAAGVGPNTALNNDCSVGVAGLFSFTNADSMFSGDLSPGDWRWYIGNIQAQRVSSAYTEAPAYRVAGNQVVGARGAAVADATDAASAITQLNLLLARIRGHGLIA